MSGFAYLLLALLALELALLLVVKIQRRTFPWIITETDEYPDHSQAAIRKFFQQSHDPELGWVRRPKSQGVERGENGTVSYSIDELGARLLPCSMEPRFAAFGDSYVFCRQVGDHDTWPVELSRLTGHGVLNFGVGNYGVDQALLRYERTSLPETIDHVILGFVPETICRIHSAWKHYLEFGNSLAFKPRFALANDGTLVHLPNVVRTEKDFSSLKELIPEIQHRDFFYRSKFRSMQFRFPYTLSFFRNATYNATLMSAVALRATARLLGLRKANLENLPFSIVMKKNILDAHEMYFDRDAGLLLAAILQRFVEEARRRGHRPLVLVMPQLLDLKVAWPRAPYQNFFLSLSESIPLLDLTESLRSEDFLPFYVEDKFGGHFSVTGNKVVASKLADFYGNPYSEETRS